VKKNTNFRWDVHVHGKALDEIKKALSEPPVLRFYEPGADITLQCDASEFGLGACLLANGQPVQYASRALTETERQYAQIEKEMLSIVFGLERFERYVYGRDITVENDHKPLIPIHKKFTGCTKETTAHASAHPEVSVQAGVQERDRNAHR
jgi:hypothetical protein